MSNATRIGSGVVAVVVLVVAFLLLSPGDDDDSKSARTTTSVVPAAAPAADHEPAFTHIRVRTGEPYDGVKTITVSKGERVRLEVASQDTSDDVHIHGYDLKRPLKARDSVRFSFVADAEGKFEIELEDAGTQIGELVVEPK